MTFDSLYASSTATNIEVLPLLLSMLAAIGLGLVLAFVYSYRSAHTKSFVTTLALLPAIVCVVIAMVNGNVGTGVAVAGAFSLVRFRSAPGSAREICFIFLAMAVGLVCGMGYVDYAAIVTVVLCAIILLFQRLGVGRMLAGSDRTLRITVPEDLDYTGLFDDLFDQYTTYHELQGVKTTNMGGLYKLTYSVGLVSDDKSREFIDALRVRNGNLEVSLAHQSTMTDSL